MASIPEDALRARPLGDTVDERTSIRKIPNEKLIEYHLNPTSSPFSEYQIETEHRRRLRSSFSYADKLQQRYLEITEELELTKKRYDVFSVDGYQSLPLPNGGFFSKWIDRMQGEQCVEIIDVNDNHIADDGDTCVGRNGDIYPDARFSGVPLVVEKIGMTCNPHQFVRFDDCAGRAPSLIDEVVFDENSGMNFNVHRPGDVEQLSMSLATESAAHGNRIWNQAKGAMEAIGISVEENPVIAATLGVVLGGLLAHPVTRGPTLKGLQYVGGTGAAVGTGYLAYDRISGLTDLAATGNLEAFQRNVGNHDFTALIAMTGGFSAFRGVSVTEAARRIWWAPTTMLNKLQAAGPRLLATADGLVARLFGDIGGGGAQLALVGGGGGTGGALVMETEAGLSAAGAIAGAVTSKIGTGRIATGMIPIFAATSMRGVQITYGEDGEAIYEGIHRAGKGSTRRRPNRSHNPHRDTMGGNRRENKMVKRVVDKIRRTYRISGERLKEIRRRIHDALGSDKTLGRTELAVETAATAEKDTSFQRVRAAAEQVLEEMGIASPH